MKLLPFREIRSNTGSKTEEDLFIGFTRDNRSGSEEANDSEVTISPDLVPRLVCDKQFEVIQIRRRVQTFIEKQRLAMSQRADGLREGQFKHIQKHIVSKSRRRDPQGTFVSGPAKHILSISN